MVDLTRVTNHSRKRAVSVFSGELKAGEGNFLATSENYLLAKLPRKAVITNAYVHVITASDAATSAAATLGTASGGAQLVTGVDLKVTGEQGTFVGQVHTSTGVELWLNTTVTGAATADVGHYVVVVEYMEYTKTTGEYTDITRS